MPPRRRRTHTTHPRTQAADTAAPPASPDVEQEKPGTEPEGEQGHPEPGSPYAGQAGDHDDDLDDAVDAAILSRLSQLEIQSRRIEQQNATLIDVVRAMQVDLQGVKDVQHEAGGELGKVLTGLAPLTRLLDFVAGKRL